MSERYLVFSLSCPGCGAGMHVYDFDLLEYSEREASSSPGAHRERTRVHCAHCDSDYTFAISGAPESVRAELEEYPEVEVAIETPEEHGISQFDYSAYLHEYMPDEPEGAYYHSITQLEELQQRLDPKPSDKTFYRMLFVQYVVVMEAYLMDRLITAVTEVPSILNSLVTKHATLSVQKYPMQALAARPNLVLEEVQSFLKNNLFHNMEQVEKLYTAALGNTPFCDANHKLFLEKMAINRHHCVHRNGKDNDGQALEGIGPFYISDVSNAITAMVGNIESQIRVIQGLPA